MSQIDDENDLLNSVSDALDDVASAYVYDVDGQRLPTTVIMGPGGEIIARWERGTKTEIEVRAIVRQFGELHELRVAASRFG